MNDKRNESDRVAMELTFAILSAFENPDKWPVTDVERVELLRSLYVTAKEIDYLVKQGK